jgi:hypothetical protein
LLLSRSIATGKISRIANRIEGAVKLPKIPEASRDVFPDNEKVDDNLDLVSDDVEVDGGGGRESWHSSGDEDEDAGRCQREGAAGASAPTDSRSRFLKRARGRRNASHQSAQEKAHYRSQDGGEFLRQGGQSFAAADDGSKSLASSMTNGQEAMSQPRKMSTRKTALQAAAS